MKREYKTSQAKRDGVKKWQLAHPEKVKEYTLKSIERYHERKKERDKLPYVFKENRVVHIRIKESGTTAYRREWCRLFPDKERQYKETRKKKLNTLREAGILEKQYDKEKYQKNKEKYLENQRRWNAKNPDKIREIAKRNYEKNRKSTPRIERPLLTTEEKKERARINANNYYQKNKNTHKIKKRTKEQNQEYYQKNKEKLLKYQNDRYKNNKNK